MRILPLIPCLFAGLLAGDAIAAEQRLIVAAPKCNAAQITKEGVDAVSKVEKAEWDGGYIVMIDPSKLPIPDFMEKLRVIGCFAQ